MNPPSTGVATTVPLSGAALLGPERKGFAGLLSDAGADLTHRSAIELACGTLNGVRT